MKWTVPRHYQLGEHATWQGIRIVCTRDHYAGEAAEHPWDPGDGWPAEKAATLWSPNGPREARKLSAWLAERTRSPRDVDRLYYVLDRAVSG